MKYVYVSFIRGEGRLQERGEIADVPHGEYPLTDEPFIVCKVDQSILTADLLTDDKVKLDLADLQGENTTEEYQDEQGNTHVRDVYDYYDINGQSSKEKAPVITINDIIRGDK